MDQNKNENTFLKKLLKKYRFVIMTESTFEKKFSVSFSWVNLILLMVFLFSCFGFFLYLLVEDASEAAKQEAQKDVLELTLQYDVLERRFESRDLYIENIKRIIRGDSVLTSESSLNQDSSNSSWEGVDFANSEEDSLLRVLVEKEEIGSLYEDGKEFAKHYVFFAPVKGMISDIYNEKIRHFGVDIVAKKGAKINSVLDGTVILSDWNSETGYVIVVQHANNFISLYKHNSLLLKKVGDFVRAGDNIAVIGNSGHLSSGPHLHFELWSAGSPVNPEDYISF